MADGNLHSTQIKQEDRTQDQWSPSINSKIEALVVQIAHALLAQEDQVQGIISPKLAEEKAHAVVNDAVSISFPLADFAQTGLISMDGDWTSGRVESVKATNILLNPRKLLQAVVKSGVTAVAVVHEPYTGSLLFADLIYSLYDIARITLSEREGAIICVISQATSVKEEVPYLTILEQVNQQLSSNGRGPMNEQELSSLLSQLQKSKCVEAVGDRDSNWRLSEALEVQYED